MANLIGSSKLTATWRSYSFSLLLSVYFTDQPPFWLIRRHWASLWYNKSDNFFVKMSVIWFLFRRKNNVVVNFLIVVNFFFFFHREVNQVMTAQILRLTLSRVYTYLYIVYVLAYTLTYAFDTINSSVYILIYVLRNKTCFSRAVAIYLSLTLFKPNRVGCKTYKSGISFLS